MLLLLSQHAFNNLTVSPLSYCFLLRLLLNYRQVPAASRNFTIAVFDQPEPAESEDCLYLNVFAPSRHPPFGGYAVMFWIYGGSLEFGNAGQPGYDGSGFAAFEEVIVVTANYRTNGTSITPYQPQNF